MTGFLNWWKSEKRYMVLFKSLLMAVLPVTCCFVYCAMQGKRIGDVYLPLSEWNDELFYFKQVEGIVNCGYPQGYFGFNESHALKLSFAAWSPVLVFPWILWGLLFGWNFMSPVICNILLLTIVMFIFVWLVRPTWKQIGILTLLFCLYTPFVRYMLSGMPEIICFSLLILFYGIALNYLKNQRTYKLVLLFLLSGLLTLMRPYMLLFFLLPMYLWIRRKKAWGIIGSLVILSGVLGTYALIKHYLGAEYFTPLFFTDWITAFFEKGLLGGIHDFFGKLYWMGRSFMGHTIEGFRSGLASGAFFGGYLVIMAVLLWQSISDIRKYRKDKHIRKEKQQTEGAENKLPDLLVVEAHLAFSFVGMLFALLLMYKLTEGSKHLLTFMAVGIFVVSLMRTKFYKKAVFIGATFAYLYSYMAIDPYDYQVPFVEHERQEQISIWQECLAEELVLTKEEVPNYDNVVIWTLWDETEEGRQSSKWQVLYALPAGFGISCCEGTYVLEHLETLQSKYLATICGGAVDDKCMGANYREIYRDDDMVLYER